MKAIRLEGQNEYSNCISDSYVFAQSDLPRFTSAQNYMLQAKQNEWNFDIPKNLSVSQNNIEEISEIFWFQMKHNLDCFNAKESCFKVVEI